MRSVLDYFQIVRHVRRRVSLQSPDRSEEHTSELQSRGHLVCRLLLEKKKHSDKDLPQNPSHRHNLPHAYLQIPNFFHPVRRHPPPPLLSHASPLSWLCLSATLLHP